MNIYKKILTLLCLASFVSCGDWLSITPSNQATNNQIYETGDGIRTALNGLYKNMGSFSLYGGELQFALVDCISQQYAISRTSMGGNAEKYVAAYKFDFTNRELTPDIEKMWLDAYNIIANANNLIQNVELKNADIFEKGIEEKNLILGEAYACRALLHFDLLRIFAPSLQNDDNRVYIPYVDKYPNIQAKGTGVKDCLVKIIADLEKGRELTAMMDTTTFGMGASASGNARFNNKFEWGWGDDGNPGVVNDFFKGRGYRLSYYSITALLARVYQYAGKEDKAFEYADKVLNFKAKAYDGGLYDMFSKEEFFGFMYETNPANFTDIKVMSSLIFGVYNKKAYEDNNLENYFANNPQGGGPDPAWFRIGNLDDIFTNTENENESQMDIRLTKLVFNVHGFIPISNKYYLNEDIEKRDNNVSIQPVIRASEMRYIKAEYLAKNGKIGEAYDILNQMRSNRGVFNPLTITSSYDEFEKDLINDARREWMSEGQLLYLYKRLNAKVKIHDGTIRVLKREETMLPIPMNQVL